MSQYLHRQPIFVKRLWALSIPAILQNLITFSLGTIDTLMVSQLGNEAVAAVSTANVPVFLLISLVFGVQSGLGILISQYWGKGDTENISRAMGVASFFGVGLCTVLSVVFFLFPVQVMDLLSNDHSLSLLGAPYLRIIGFSYVFNMFSSVYVSAQRSVENFVFGMKLFGFSTLLNTFLNYLLIFGKFGCPALGITGAALATLLARCGEFVIALVCMVRSRTIPLNSAAFFCPGKDMALRFVRYSWPVVLNETAWGMGNSMLTVILGHTHNSVEMLSANAVIGNLFRMFLVVCFGLGASTAVVVGKSIGEGRPRDEVQDLGNFLCWFAFRIGIVLAAVSLALVPVLFIPVLFPLFKLYGETARVATALATVSFAMIPFHAHGVSSITGVFRAGGDVKWATLMDLVPQWCIAVPLTALTALVLRSNCWLIALAMQTEVLIKMPLCLLRFRTGRWIHDVTRPHFNSGGDAQ